MGKTDGSDCTLVRAVLPGAMLRGRLLVLAFFCSVISLPDGVTAALPYTIVDSRGECLKLQNVWVQNKGTEDNTKQMSVQNRCIEQQAIAAEQSIDH